MNGFLLDTQLLLWYAVDRAKLPPLARNLISSPQSVLYFSMASLWEVGIKAALRKPSFTISPAKLYDGLVDWGWHRLDIHERHIFHLADLALHHRDPFDRMLVAQAEVEQLRLMTADRTLPLYSSSVLFVG